HLQVGPGPHGSKISSGLLTICQDINIVRTESRVFGSAGNMNRDTDAWARKGVLLTELDLHVGHLELYSTHLFFGGGFPIHVRSPILEIGGDPSAEERTEIQFAQIDELTRFVRDTHHPENVVMIVGDFNLDARSAAAYAGLVERMGETD